jgi:hypothetical protein
MPHEKALIFHGAGKELIQNPDALHGVLYQFRAFTTREGERFFEKSSGKLKKHRLSRTEIPDFLGWHDSP